MRGNIETFEQIARDRISVRSYLSTPLSTHLLHSLVEDAQTSPSNCNTQPWAVHIVSGTRLKALSALLIEAFDAGQDIPDFSFDAESFPDPYDQRRQDQGAHYYKSLGIERGDKAARRDSILKNLKFFGAPHAAFLLMPSMGDNVRVASDVGMYAQTFLLSLTARGLAGIPQTLLGFYPDTLRKFLGVPADMKVLFGISFGYPDKAHVSYQNKIGRAPVSESVTFHS